MRVRFTLLFISFLFSLQAFAGLIANVVITNKKGFDKSLTIVSEYHTAEEIFIGKPFEFSTRSGLHFEGVANIDEFAEYGPSTYFQMNCSLSLKRDLLGKEYLKLKLNEKKIYTLKEKDRLIEVELSLLYR